MATYNKVSQIKKDAVIDMLEEGCDLRSVAIALDIPLNTVKSIKRTHGQHIQLKRGKPVNS